MIPGPARAVPTGVKLEDFGRFVGWLRPLPTARRGTVTVLPGLPGL